MDSYQVTDEGDGLVRVDAQIRLVRKPIAVAMCDEVDKVVAGYDRFRILMNMSAMSKGTPAAGFFVLRTMKKYPLQALAFFGANGFMRGMATTVLGLAGFRNFEMFEDEAAARDWLERGGSPSAGPAPASRPISAGGLKRLAFPAGLLTSAALVLRLRRRRNRVV
jgi:stage II sporulation SpoAA-like protein